MPEISLHVMQSDDSGVSVKVVRGFEAPEEELDSVMEVRQDYQERREGLGSALQAVHQVIT